MLSYPDRHFHCWESILWLSSKPLFLSWSTAQCCEYSELLHIHGTQWRLWSCFPAAIWDIPSTEMGNQEQGLRNHQMYSHPAGNWQFSLFLVEKELKVNSLLNKKANVKQSPFETVKTLVFLSNLILRLASHLNRDCSNAPVASVTPGCDLTFVNLPWARCSGSRSLIQKVVS